jgi:hypothetical protein
VQNKRKIKRKINRQQRNAEFADSLCHNGHIVVDVLLKLPHCR